MESLQLTEPIVPGPATDPRADPPDAVQAVPARANVRHAKPTRLRGCRFTAVTVAGCDHGEIRAST